MAVARIRVERDVGDDADLRHGRLDGARRPGRRGCGCSAPPSRARREAPGRCWERARSPGMPRDAARSAARTASSIASRSTPGIERDRLAVLSPSIRKSGQIRSSVVSRFSRTSRRDQSALRLRRGRCVRRAASGAASVATRTREGRELRHDSNLRRRAAGLRDEVAHQNKSKNATRASPDLRSVARTALTLRTQARLSRSSWDRSVGCRKASRSSARGRGQRVLSR